MLNSLPLISYYFAKWLRNRCLIVCFSVVCFSGIAQSVDSLSIQSTNTTNSLIKDLQNRYTFNRQKAYQLAQKHKWVLHKNYANGNTLTLQGIDTFGNPVYYTTHNVVASAGTHTAELYKGGDVGIDLKGDSPELNGRLCIWDGRLPRLPHVAFAGRVRQKDNNKILSDHSTHLVGTLAAAGVNPQVKGMAFNARVDVWDYTDDLVEMTREASKILVSNHAYGPVVGWFFNTARPGTNPKLKWEWWGNTAVSNTEDYRFGFYDEKARDLDLLAYNNPFYLIVKSADNKRTETGPTDGSAYFIKNTNQTSTLWRSKNDSYDVIPAEANAKNILTVGGATISLKDGLMTGFSVANFSGWGPTDDGRIKPDLLGVGTSIISAISSADNAYATMSGTSTACANVSGTLILLQELFYKQNKYFMRSATLKGLAIHTANKPDGLVKPSYEYGWGLLNAEKAALTLLNEDKKQLVLERSLRQNETYQQKIVANGSEPLIVTIVWTDPEGKPTTVSAQNLNNRSPKLINDLDLRITDEKGNSLLPWVLDPANPSRPASTGDNIRDNVEQVFIASPTLGATYTVSIKHKRTLLNNSQPYSLIISGLQPQNCDAAVRLVSGKDTVLCGDARVRMQVQGDVGLEYQWLKDGAVWATTKTPTYDLTQVGQYTVRAVGYLCSALSKSINVKVLSLPSKVTPEGTAAICAGTPLLLTANTGNGYQYQWLRNGQPIPEATKNILNPTETGNYSVVINYNNCTATSKETQLSSIVQKPVISTNSGTVIPFKGSISLTTTAMPGISYRWLYNDRHLKTATSSRLVATAAGSYVVEITQYGCSLMSKPLLLTATQQTTVDNTKSTLPDILIKEELLTIYPNPVINWLTVSYLSDNTYDLEATIVTLDGKVLKEKLLFDNGKEFFNQFNVSDLPTGRYFIRVTDGVRVISKPFLKQ
jgi:hypothetical protein